VTLLFNDALLSTNHLKYTPNCSAINTVISTLAPPVGRQVKQPSVCTSVIYSQSELHTGQLFCLLTVGFKQNIFQKLQHKEKVKTFTFAQCLLADRASMNEQHHAVQLTDI
jgi:hypothetical protein